jgi:hypothetical protein
MLSSEALHNAPGSTTSHGTSNKHTSASALNVDVSGNTQPLKLYILLKVALGKVNSFVKTLHPDLASFVENLLKCTFVTMWPTSEKKHQLMKDDHA